MIRFFKCLDCKCQIMIEGIPIKFCPLCMKDKGFIEITKKEFEEW